MKNFKAVSMDCNQEQFESMREELIELGCNISAIVKFSPDTYILVNNYIGRKNKITNVYGISTADLGRQYIGAFDKEAFLQACGKVEEVNKSGWYVVGIYGKYLMFHDYEKGIKFGFNIIGNWYNGVDKTMGVLKQATNEQVLQRLTEEADKRGYKEGVIIDNSNLGFGKYTKVKNLRSNKVSVNEFNELCLGGWAIMKDGIWADIVPNEIEVVEPVKIGIAKIEFSPDLQVLDELKKEKKHLILSRNRYKQLYEQEKALRKEYSDMIDGYEEHSDFISNEIERIKNEVKENKKEIKQWRWCYWILFTMANIYIWYPVIKKLLF